MLRVNISRHQSIFVCRSKGLLKEKKWFLRNTHLYLFHKWVDKQEARDKDKDDSKSCKVESLTPTANGLIILYALSSCGSHSWVRMAGQDNQLPGYIASDSGFERAVRHFPHLNNFSNQTSHPFKIPDQNLLPNSPLPGFASFCCL